MKMKKMTDYEKLRSLLSISRFQEMKVSEFNKWLQDAGGISAISKIGKSGEFPYTKYRDLNLLNLTVDWSKLKKGDKIPSSEKCSFCGLDHLHNGGNGWRSAHCPSPPVIKIVTSDGTLLSSSDGIFIVNINKK